VPSLFFSIILLREIFYTYDLTKSLWENIEEIGNSITAAKGAKLEQAASNLAGLPLHPGAKKYYQEKGVLK